VSTASGEWTFLGNNITVGMDPVQIRKHRGGHDMGGVTGSVDLAGCEWLQYEYGSVLMARDRPGSFTMWRYRDLLPVPDGPVRYPVLIRAEAQLPEVAGPDDTTVERPETTIGAFEEKICQD
jgi:hypothetical protein